jgi:hypothetical protein
MRVGQPERKLNYCLIYAQILCRTVLGEGWVGGNRARSRDSAILLSVDAANLGSVGARAWLRSARRAWLRSAHELGFGRRTSLASVGAASLASVGARAWVTLKVPSSRFACLHALSWSEVNIPTVMAVRFSRRARGGRAARRTFRPLIHSLPDAAPREIIVFRGWAILSFSGFDR